MKVPAVLGLVLVLVPSLLLMAVYVPEENISPNPLRALIAQQSNLELFYAGWQKRYLARGGDRNIEIPVAWTDSLSTEPSAARGRVFLDLIDGAVSAEVQGLDGRPADLWLVDNREGPGRTVRPEPGDRMIHLGSLLTQGTVSRMATGLVPGLFEGFEIDLAVVSAPGRTPAESRLLVGTRPFFERLYTRTRVARETRRENRLLGPASLLAVLSPRPAEADSTVLVSHGLVSQAAAEGADLFFRETFGGNGRTCGTCHRAESNLGLDVAFISRLPARDKLFIAEHPPEEGGVPGLERPQLMRAHAQILMNSDGFENPTGKFIMRAAPHILSLATSILSPDNRIPVQRTGWAGDAAPGSGELRLLPNAAVKQHFTRSLDRVEGVDFALPTDEQLDKMEAFLLSAGRLRELDLRNVRPANAAAQAGQVSFGICETCHLDAGAAVRRGLNLNLITGVERAPDPSQATEPHPHDGGFGTDGRDCDGDGTFDCFGDHSFNVQPLIEAADTEPFFHNHSAATLEDAVAFYTTENFTFFQSPLPLSQEDVLNIGAFLRVLNAAFNSAISIQRNTAALTIEKSRGRGTRDTVNMLLALSSSEAADAVEVLSHRELHPKTVKLLRDAIAMNGRAMAATQTNARQRLIRRSLDTLKAAKAQLGTGLDFTLGEGNLLF